MAIVKGCEIANVHKDVEIMKPCTLLVGICIGVATLENTSDISLKNESWLNLWSSTSLLSFYLKKTNMCNLDS